MPHVTWLAVTMEQTCSLQLADTKNAGSSEEHVTFILKGEVRGWRFPQNIGTYLPVNAGSHSTLSSISHMTLGNLTWFLSFLLKTIKNYHPWQHDTTLHQAAHGGDSLQQWRVATNIINNQRQTAKTEWHSRNGVGWQKTRMLHNITTGFGLKWILWNV